MSRVAAWNGEEWVDRIASQAEQRERWRSGGRRWVNTEDVYGTEQAEEGWHALWELTEVRCECGAIEVVPWRPGHRNSRPAGAVLRSQCVECWECGEVLDLRLQRRDRQAEDDTEDARITRELRVLYGEFPRRQRVRAGAWVPRQRWKPPVARKRRAPSVVGSRDVARAKARGTGEVQTSGIGAVSRIIKKTLSDVAGEAARKKASRAEAIRRARAYKGGIRFRVAKQLAAREGAVAHAPGGDGH